MSKMSIKWHEDCLKNRKASLERDKKEYQIAQTKYFETLKSVEKYERQIERAKKLGKDEFDEERFKDE